MNVRRELDSLNERLTREAEMRFDKAILDVKYPQDAPHSEDDVMHLKMEQTWQSIDQSIKSIGETSKRIGAVLGSIASALDWSSNTKLHKERGL
jgi:hypothetical protein